MTDKIVASIYFVFNNESKIPITLINNFDRGSVWVELESGDPEISKYGPDDGCSLVCKPYKVSKYGKDLEKVITFKDVKYNSYDVYVQEFFSYKLKSGKMSKSLKKRIRHLGIVEELKNV